MARGPEAALALKFEQACSAHGIAYRHETDSRKSRPGRLDYQCIGWRDFEVELKAEHGALTPAQCDELALKAKAGVPCYVFTPANEPMMRAILAYYSPQDGQGALAGAEPCRSECAASTPSPVTVEEFVAAGWPRQLAEKQIARGVH